LFTANTLDGIPAPVLSRVVVFDVPDLTPSQAKSVAIAQYQEMLEDLKLPVVAPELTQEGLTLLASESPRRQRLLLQLAIGSAVYKKSKELVIQKVNKPKKGIGFVI
jgi:ATP-dependent Lon protease